jgi:16S rRNA (guanine966-N2)-methyltransferase
MVPPRPRSPRSPDAAAGTPGSVRIIGGRWRGSKLPVPAQAGLRPTPDRVRETLFNWLAPVLPGSRCLDLFAGSGALGFEAASRGARRVLAIEREPRQVASLRDSAARLGGDGVEVLLGDALAWLRAAPVETFDIAFVDPPFASGLWAGVRERLPAHLAESAWLYVEQPVDADVVPPAGFALHREGRTRETAYRLFRRGGAAAGP